MSRFLMSVVVMVSLWPFTSQAGEHRELCEKVKLSHHVVEIEFRVNAPYPESARKKRWGPPESSLNRIKRTGRVTQVFKGDLSVGDPWNSRWKLRLSAGGRVAEWEAFFRRKRFRRVVFLVKPDSDEGRWRSPGWAEESAGCGGTDSNHRSWCAGYADYTSAVLACIASEQPALRPVPPAVLSKACSDPCAGEDGQLIVWRDQNGAPKILQAHGSPVNCSHPPTAYYDMDGHYVYGEAQTPVDEAGQHEAQQKRDAILKGLKTAETTSCAQKKPTESP